jgi:2OG-Fe(II) oxygenase superfamily
MNAYVRWSTQYFIYFAALVGSGISSIYCTTVVDAFVGVTRPFVPSRGRRPGQLVAFRNAAVTAIDIPSLEEALQGLGVKSTVKVLSKDPLIYLIPGLLSAQECEAYRRYVVGNDDDSPQRPMTRSNPPEVSLDASKLWPLPLLSLLAGVPPYIRLQEASSDVSVLDILAAVVPNVAIALTAMGALAWLLVLPLIRKVSDSSSRTSVATALNLEDDIDFVRPLVDRVSAAARDHPWQCWEAPVVTRYDPGSFFARHGDASPTKGSEWKDAGGQRVVTCICYLNTLKEGEGGETYFDKLALAVSPQAGTALVFYPADAETWYADDRTTHESLAPTVEKWIVQLFGRAERVPPPLGLPHSFGC